MDFGQEITARITYIREDGRVNLSLRQQKENAMIADAEDILNFLHKRNGKMPYCDTTPMEIIKEKFGISKAAVSYTHLLILFLLGNCIIIGCHLYGF